VRPRVASSGGYPTRHYKDSRKQTLIMLIYYSHIDIVQMFMSCELPKYYSSKHDTLEALWNNYPEKIRNKIQYHGFLFHDELNDRVLNTILNIFHTDDGYYCVFFFHDELDHICVHKTLDICCTDTEYALFRVSLNCVYECKYTYTIYTYTF